MRQLQFDKTKFKKILGKYFPKYKTPKIEFVNGRRDDDVKPNVRILGDFGNNIIRVFRVQERIVVKPELAKKCFTRTILHELAHWQCWPYHYVSSPLVNKYFVLPVLALVALALSQGVLAWFFVACYVYGFLLVWLTQYPAKCQTILASDSEENANVYAEEMLQMPLGQEITSCIKIVED